MTSQQPYKKPSVFWNSIYFKGDLKRTVGHPCHCLFATEQNLEAFATFSICHWGCLLSSTMLFLSQSCLCSMTSCKEIRRPQETWEEETTDRDIIFLPIVCMYVTRCGIDSKGTKNIFLPTCKTMQALQKSREKLRDLYHILSDFCHTCDM